ncbi:hypothetical protein ACKKBF_B31930 [Auxenochlorella protothecoides x Auxenochlorella symbiontica]
MAHKILGNYGAAREGAYFKSEQEAELQRHRDRLVREGAIDKAVPRSDPKSVSESLHAYEVLPEVLQQQARIDDPHAAQRKAFHRRVKGSLPPLTPEERYRFRMAGAGLGAGLGHIPRLSLGRDRYNIPQGSGAGQAAAPARALSPEAVEVARRTYVAGLRALVYGTLLGFGALALAGTYVAQAMELGQPGADAGRSVRSALEPTTRRLRDGAARLRAALGGWAARESGEWEPRSEFQQRMMARYNPGSLGGRGDGEVRAPGREWREP